MASSIITRAEAKAGGLKRYFTGEPCKHGHVAERATVNGLCLDCGRTKNKVRYWTDPDADRARQKLRRDGDPMLNERKRQRRHAADPALMARVETRAADRAAREAAQSGGSSMYVSPKACTRCGSSRRFAGDGKCVECNRIACGRRDLPSRLERRALIAAKKADRMNRSSRAAAVRSARQHALRNGELTYVGRPCPSGHDGLRYAKHGSCVACAAANSASDAKKRYDAEYFAGNRQRILIRTRAYLAANRERQARNLEAWRSRNPARVAAIKQNYKHRRRAQEAGGITSRELYQWKSRQRKICHWCATKCEKRFHVDHIEPLSKGGLHVAANLCIACPTCNLRKSARDPIEFAQSLGLLL